MKQYDDEFDCCDEDEILEAEVADENDYDEVIDGRVRRFRRRVRSAARRVLDEIAELKRSMENGAGRGRQSDPALYDEIGRLRGELADARRSQSMQEELEKMRSRLEREYEEKTAKLTAEINELKSRLSEPAEAAPSAGDDGRLKAIEAELVPPRRRGFRDRFGRRQAGCAARASDRRDGAYAPCHRSAPCRGQAFAERI